MSNKAKAKEYKYPALPEGLREVWAVQTKYTPSLPAKTLCYLDTKPTPEEMKSAAQTVGCELVLLRQALITLGDKHYRVVVTQPVKHVGTGFLYDNLPKEYQRTR